jgi:hypothetical protein
MNTIPLTILAVVVAYVASARFSPVPGNAKQATELIQEAPAVAGGTLAAA